ncbi:MAG: RNA methyltransferase [Proteobacteria bacterium]|nr:RNA methyltransferase [Pseudomonadota bacterium]MBU1584738.1 RNA methyltransferase [Pseudomonadota bacterium]MBU2454428.1 RNA methyltransferase [Pseudomonadota bacterium]MBU2628807.1 RNA methyltransferase [Pseudomonadota bacterium]
MDTFGFTKKKLMSFCLENQHSHIINWLSEFYHKLTTNRVNQISFDLFVQQYNQILQWTGMTPFIKPEPGNTRLWIEMVSDRIHYHRSATERTCRDHDLFEKVKTDDLPFSCHQIDFNCHVALDGLRSLFNVGSIFRTCDAAGVASILLGNTLGKEHPGVQKTAMGAEKWVKQEKTTDLSQTLLNKKKEGLHIVGVETIKGARPYYDMSWKKNTIVVFGNEEYGISSHVMATCDTFVYIPMFGKKNSINVANAVSIVCFHIAQTLAT